MSDEKAVLTEKAGAVCASADFSFKSQSDKVPGVNSMSMAGVKVLVTGADKVLGQAIVNELYEKNAVPFPLDGSYGYDVTNEAKVLQALILSDPDVVIHAEPRGGAPSSLVMRDVLSMGIALVHGCAIKKTRLVLVNRLPAGTGVIDVATVAIAGLAKAYKDEAAHLGQPFDFCSINLPDLFGPGDLRTGHPVQQIAEIAIRGTAMGVSDWRMPGKGGGKFRGLYIRDAARAIVAQAAVESGGASVDFGGSLLDVKVVIEEALKACGNPGDFAWTGESTAWDEVQLPFGKTDVMKAVTPLSQAIQETVAWLANVLRDSALKA